MSLVELHPVSVSASVHIPYGTAVNDIDNQVKTLISKRSLVHVLMTVEKFLGICQPPINMGVCSVCWSVYT